MARQVGVKREVVSLLTNIVCILKLGEGHARHLRGTSMCASARCICSAWQGADTCTSIHAICMREASAERTARLYSMGSAGNTHKSSGAPSGMQGAVSAPHLARVQICKCRAAAVARVDGCINLDAQQLVAGVRIPCHGHPRHDALGDAQGVAAQWIARHQDSILSWHSCICETQHGGLLSA